MTRRERRERAFEAEVEIDAPVDAVWKAIADADELMRWFPTRAEVVPGEGGRVRWVWADFYDWRLATAVWRPGEHLRLTYDSTGAVGGEKPLPAPLAIDWFLEGKGGSTVLRLVHSGFGEGAEWDAEFDGISRGWTVELRVLKHYLENHRGEERRVALVIQPTQRPVEEVWSRLMGPEGFVREGSVRGLEEGAQYAITSALGDRFEGWVMFHSPKKEFTGVATNLEDGVFRVWVEGGPDGATVWLWLATYGVAAEEVEAFRAKWAARLAELFGEGKTRAAAAGGGLGA